MARQEGCKYCSYPYLDGFNCDMLSEYSDDESIGVSVDIRNNFMDIEVDLGNRAISHSLDISYCPMCGKGL